MSMTAVKTQDLTGAALDWAVAGATNEQGYWAELFQQCVITGKTLGGISLKYSPSTDWSQAGPLLEKHKIGFGPVRGGWVAHPHRPNEPTDWMRAEAPLVAICRAIVADKLGMVVTVPAELIQ